MPQAMQSLIEQYISEIKKIYGSHLQKVILYGSYARGDFKPDSDVDIMILLDMSDLDLKAYSQKLSYMTYDFNLDNDLDIKPIAKSKAHFEKWIANYPFFMDIRIKRIVCNPFFKMSFALSNRLYIKVIIQIKIIGHIAKNFLI